MDVDAGRFANVRNNPVVQEIPFEAVAARYFRFTALQSSDTRASAAEISVLPAEQH
jgi:alpha-L-fucosidase